MLADVIELPTGREYASKYERAIESLLTALFYPALSQPTPQTEIHQGRKRIDITYSNVATKGFFLWLSQNYSAPFVFVECKNYSTDPQNPELDQLSGRFSPNRGKFGVLVCRQISDKALMADRCRDTANDDRGFIIYLDDNDLANLVNHCKTNPNIHMDFDLLQTRFNALIS